MNSPQFKFTGALIALLLMVVPANAQTFKSDGAPSPQMLAFGGSVAVDNGVVFVGEPANNVTSGFVYVYEKQGDMWEEVSRLAATDATASDGFGRAIDAVDNTVLIGATGKTFAFTRDGDSWVQNELVGSTVVEGDNFGSAIAYTGHSAFVGAPTPPDAPGNVYYFHGSDDGSWSEHRILQASDASAGDRFGSVVEFGGGYFFAAATRADSAAGAVYVFKHDEENHTWTEVQKLSASDADPNDRFGSTIHYADGFLLVASPRHDAFQGKVYIFAETGEGFAEVASLTPFDGTRGSQFGAAIATSGNEVWIGVPGSSGFAGSVYVHTSNETKSDWLSVKKLMATDGAARDFMGSAIAIDGDIAVTGMSGADYNAGSALIFEKEDGMWTEAARLSSSASTLQAVTGEEVSCSEGKADAFECGKVNLVSFLPVKDIGGGRGVKVNDIWGWTDPQTGKEYALVGRVDGTSFVDVSDPYNPVYLGNLEKTEGSPGSTWRDIKVYKNYAFIVADGAGNHGMQVFDLTQLRDVEDAPVEFEQATHYTEIASAHNIVINEDTGFAYAVGSSAGGTTCGGGLHMINIQDPLNPTFAGCFADENTGRRGTGYTHDAQCVTYSGPDSDYTGREICFNANETALSIGDVTDKENTVAISHASYPKVGYSHQGWLTEDQQFFFMNDELDELGGNVEYTRTLIWDVSDLDDPQLVKEFLSHEKASDHNLYIKDNFVYQSNYQAGLRILDISDVTNPVEVGYFDTVPYGTNDAGFGGSWSNYPYFESGIIVVTSGEEGLFVVKKSDVGI